MSKRSSAEWASLVSRWKRSGRTAEEFAAKVGVKAASLRWWSWALGKRRLSRNDEPAIAANADSTPTPIPAFLPVRVVSRDASSTHATQLTGVPVEIIVDERVTVRVSTGFDEDTLLRVLDILRRVEAT